MTTSAAMFTTNRDYYVHVLSSFYFCLQANEWFVMKGNDDRSLSYSSKAVRNFSYILLKASKSSSDRTSAKILSNLSAPLKLCSRKEKPRSVNFTVFVRASFALLFLEINPFCSKSNNILDVVARLMTSAFSISFWVTSFS